MLAGVMNTGGCLAWKKDLDAANSYNESLRLQIVSLQDDLARIEAEKKDLEARLALGGTDAEVALLTGELQQLQADYDALVAKYRDLVNRAPIALPPTMNLALEQFAAAHSDMIEYMPSLGMVKFKADLTFPKGSDDIQPAATTALREFARIVSSAEAQEFNVYIAGHTDDIPIKKDETRRRHPNNWYLSVHRAVSVEKALESAGVSPKRLAVMGFGEYHPTVANAPNRQGNQANRRVEIWIVPPKQFLTGAP